LHQRLKALFLGRSPHGYARWISENEPGPDELERQRRLQADLRLRGKVSIVVPVYNPDLRVFRSKLASVAAQTYDNWELCIADASTDHGVIEEVAGFSRRFGERVKVKRLEQNYGISGNSNHALSLASGDYCLLLDHDDALAPFALYELAAALNEAPDAGFLYSDRDIITCDGERMAHFFKPHWSPDLLLSQNYLCHAAVIHRDIVDSLGGFRREYDGSQDYDYFLRATELAGRVVHISKVLYHWRIVDGSSSVDSDAKPYAYEAAIRALNAALERRGWRGRPSHGFSKGYYEIEFPYSGARLGMVLDTSSFNGSTDGLFKVIRRGRECQVAIIGSLGSGLGSARGSREWLKWFSLESDGGVTGCLNDAVDWLDADVILFVKLVGDKPYDLHLPHSTLGLAERNMTGVVVPRLLTDKGRILSTGLALSDHGPLRLHEGLPRDSIGYNGMAKCLQNVSACEDFCFLFRKGPFKDVGGFDPGFKEFFAADFCLRLFQRGYVTVYDPSFEVIVPESCGQMALPGIDEEYGVFMKRWRPLLERGDLYYNPNFDQRNGGFNLI